MLSYIQGDGKTATVAVRCDYRNVEQLRQGVLASDILTKAVKVICASQEICLCHVNRTKVSRDCQRDSHPGELDRSAVTPLVSIRGRLRLTTNTVLTETFVLRPPIVEPVPS